MPLYVLFLCVTLYKIELQNVCVGVCIVAGHCSAAVVRWCLAGPAGGCTAGAVCTNCHPGICTRRDYVPFGVQHGGGPARQRGRDQRGAGARPRVRHHNLVIPGVRCVVTLPFRVLLSLLCLKLYYLQL